jgi:hypothetical protein
MIGSEPKVPVPMISLPPLQQKLIISRQSPRQWPLPIRTRDTADRRFRADPDHTG